jgi:hypothetical protein
MVFFILAMFVSGLLLPVSPPAFFVKKDEGRYSSTQNRP